MILSNLSRCYQEIYDLILRNNDTFLLFSLNQNIKLILTIFIAKHSELLISTIILQNDKSANKQRIFFYLKLQYVEACD